MGKRQSGKNILILWDALKQIKQQDPDCIWCFMGDFNNIRHHSEREGISPRGAEASIINDFNEWIAFSTGLAWDFFWRATPEVLVFLLIQYHLYCFDYLNNIIYFMPSKKKRKYLIGEREKSSEHIIYITTDFCCAKKKKTIQEQKMLFKKLRQLPDF